MTNLSATLPVPARWPGLGGWNLYFLAKFLLVALGMLDFQALPNLLFAAFLLVPLPGPASCGSCCRTCGKMGHCDHQGCRVQVYTVQDGIGQGTQADRTADPCERKIVACQGVASP